MRGIVPDKADKNRINRIYYADKADLFIWEGK